jgi:hypothetical protein
MPLLDHFRPPLIHTFPWESLHTVWASHILEHLNRDVLPRRYFAVAHIHLGDRVEIDVAALDRGETQGHADEDEGGVAVAVWAPPRATGSIPVPFSDPDVFEVQIYKNVGGPRLVAAIELVSPANKDRPATRRAFAVKCASYLQSEVSVVIGDVVTELRSNLHDDLLNVMDLPDKHDEAVSDSLYAASYRPLLKTNSPRLDYWLEPLALGTRLPTLPLWLLPDFAVPLDLERPYKTACEASRIVERS